MSVIFFNKKRRQIRSNKMRIESARVRVTFKHFNCLSLIFKAVLIMSVICTFKVNKKKAAVLSFWLCRCPKQNKYHTTNAKEHMRKKTAKQITSTCCVCRILLVNAWSTS